MAAAQALKAQLDEYLQAGTGMVQDSTIDETNVLTKTLPVKDMGTELLMAARIPGQRAGRYRRQA